MPIIILLLAFSFSSFALDCKPKEINLKPKQSREEQILELSSLPRLQVAQGLIYEVTNPKLKTNSENAKLLARFLINTEVNQGKRGFYKLLENASDLNTEAPTVLNLKEVCEIAAVLK